MLDTVLRRFEDPDEVRTFEKGKFELIHIGGMAIGRATYQPGWKWSVHVGPSVGASRCNVEHVGMVLSGCATAAMEDGTVHELRAGTVFYIDIIAPLLAIALWLAAWREWRHAAGDARSDRLAALART